MKPKLVQAPLFVIGSPRSGTSLLRLIITNHSHVVIPPESGFIVWLEQKYGCWKVKDNSNHIKLDQFISDLLGCKKMDTWGLLPKKVKEQIEEQQPKSYAELCTVIYIAYARSLEREFKIWGDKNNFYLDHLDKLHTLFKNAKFLHIVRDGRDIACSYREVMESNSQSPYAPNLKTSIRDIALEWSANVMKVDSFVRDLPDDNKITIKYEDLVSNPSKTIMSICKWLGISYEPKMMNYYQENKNKSLEPKATLDWKKRTLKPISNETVGRFARLLSQNEQEEFSCLASESLKHYSYI